MSMQTAVKKLLTSKGRTLSIVKVTSGAYNTSTGEATNTTAATSGTGHIVEDMKAMAPNGGLVQKRGLIALLAASTFAVVPEKGDRLLDGSTYYEITSIHTIKENDTTLIFKCGLGV